MHRGRLGNYIDFEMGLLDRLVVGRENRWRWFGFTFLGGGIPLLTTLIFADEYYKLVDIVFLGLTMNISNLNLVSDLEFAQKDVMVIISTAFLMGLCLCLGKIYSKSDLGMWFEIGIWFTAIISIYMNFEINNFVFKNVLKKQ